MNNLKLIVDNIKSKNLEKALIECEKHNIKENDYLINNFKGVIHSLLNNSDLAEKFFKKSHELNKNFEDPLKNLYIISIKKKNFEDAINFAEKLCNINNSNDLFFYQLAYAYEISNQNLLAIDYYEKCLNLNGPNKLKALNNIGGIFLKNNKPKTALKFFLDANEVKKNDKIISNNLLLNYIKLKDEKKADEYYLISENIDKNFEGFLYNKAQYFILKQRFDEAIVILENNKENIKFLIVLIELYFNIGNHKEAENLLNASLNKIKENKEFYNFIGIRFLREGKFEEGWKYYEHRGSKLTNKFNYIKEWNGEDLKNKSILVFSEQALGDSIMFSKYVHSLANIAGKVCFVVNKNITNIFKKDFKNISIETEDEIKTKSFDFVISIGSLVKFFYKNKYQFHDNLIQKNQTQIKSWMDRMDKTKPNVGLVWSGSFNGPNQPFRSIQLKNLVKILDLDIKYYGLQNEVWESDRDYYKNDKIFDCGKYDLAEITSIIQCLDLLISVDTGILHISSMLNKETWGIFNLYPDWRWGALYKINPYKSLIEINQTKFNQWEDVTEQIYLKLKERFNLTN